MKVLDRGAPCLAHRERFASDISAPNADDLQMTPGGIIETAAFDTADGLYDCAWSEENENIVLAASGDGSVKVYDLAAPPMANPLRVFKEHRHEVNPSMLVRHTPHLASWAVYRQCDRLLSTGHSLRGRSNHSHWPVLGFV